MRRAGRLPALTVMAALLLAGGVLDRGARREPGLSGGRATGSVMPMTAPPGALSSTWYCAGAAGPGGATLRVANAGAGTVRGRVLVVPAAGDPASVPLTVPAHGAASVRLADVLPGPHAALVELDAGQVGVELGIGGPQDSEVAPCASAASTRWIFADGSTAKDASLLLSLFNPFPEDAIADLSFSTDQGRAVPADFQGIVVPGRSLVVKEIGEHVRRRESVATEVTVRRGRLVAAQQQTRTAPGRVGVSVAVGAPSSGLVWYFADGVTGPGVVERYAIANPNRKEARILVETDLDQGVAEPLERVVPARGRVDLVLDEKAGVPPGVAHAATFRSLNNVGVVVTRATEASPPSPRAGRADTLGARRAARSWVFAGGGATEALDEWIVLANPGRARAEVSISRLAGGREEVLEGLSAFHVDPGRRRAIRLGAHTRAAELAVTVRSSVPVVVERALYDVGRPGLSATVGIPLA